MISTVLFLLLQRHRDREEKKEEVAAAAARQEDEPVVNGDADEAEVRRVKQKKTTSARIKPSSSTGNRKFQSVLLLSREQSK